MTTAPDWTLGRVTAQRDYLSAALHRVRALHSPYRGVAEDDTCAHCSWLTGLPITWPCPTIRAIEGT